MLELHLNEGADNWSSKGIYDYEEVNYSNIKDNALFIIQKDGAITEKYQFTPVYKTTAQILGTDKPSNVTFIIRKSTINNQLNYISEKEAYIFNSKEELDGFLKEKFGPKLKVEF